MKNHDLLKNFGESLKKLRHQKGISQEDFASKCGLHRTYISDIERGSRNVSLKNLKKIAEALSIEVSELTKEL